MPDKERPRPSAWDSALRYLGVRSHAKRELEAKLSRRGFEEEEITQTIERLDSAGLIDDEQFAKDLVRSLSENRLLGRKRVAQELRKRGIDDHISSAALSDLATDVDEANALKLGEKKMRQLTGVEKDVRWRRTLAFLARRGFNQRTCYRVVSQIEDELEDSGELE